MSFKKIGDTGTVAAEVDCCMMCQLNALYGNLPTEIALGGGIVSTLMSSERFGVRRLVDGLCPRHAGIYADASKIVDKARERLRSEGVNPDADGKAN